MTIIGNIFLVVASVAFCVIMRAVYGKEPTHSSDAAMGYGLGIVFLNLVFVVCMTIAAIAIARKDGFSWISADKTTQYLLVAAALLSGILTAALSALFKYEPAGQSPALLKGMSAFTPAIIPFVLIAAGFILLNSGLRDTIPVAVYKWPLAGVFLLGITGIGSGIVTWISISNENAKYRIEQAAADEARYNQGHLAEIDSCDVSINMSRILIFTDSNHDPEVRERALAKIKSNPQWEQELVRLLENKGAIEAFNFLASNEVAHKNLFAQPVNTGILSIAEWVRRSIGKASHSANLYPELFQWETDRILRSVAKFEDQGVDYRPAIRELRAALNEPASVEKPEFRCARQLDEWIKKHL